MLRYERHLGTPDETAAFGRQIGKHLPAGMVVALVGPLGAGKTTLVRAIAQELGVDPGLVASPTFALVHEYPGRLPVYHFDVYRLPDIKSFVDLGIDEYFQGPGVSLIEWADRVKSALPCDHVGITMAYDGEGRKVIVEATGVRSAEFVRTLLN